MNKETKSHQSKNLKQNTLNNSLKNVIQEIEIEIIQKDEKLGLTFKYLDRVIQIPRSMLNSGDFELIKIEGKTILRFKNPLFFKQIINYFLKITEGFKIWYKPESQYIHEIISNPLPENAIDSTKIISQYDNFSAIHFKFDQIPDDIKKGFVRYLKKTKNTAKQNSKIDSETESLLKIELTNRFPDNPELVSEIIKRIKKKGWLLFYGVHLQKKSGAENYLPKQADEKTLLAIIVDSLIKKFNDDPLQLAMMTALFRPEEWLIYLKKDFIMGKLAELENLFYYPEITEDEFFSLVRFQLQKKGCLNIPSEQKSKYKKINELLKEIDNYTDRLQELLYFFKKDYNIIAWPWHNNKEEKIFCKNISRFLLYARGIGKAPEAGFSGNKGIHTVIEFLDKQFSIIKFKRISDRRELISATMALFEISSFNICGSLRNRNLIYIRYKLSLSNNRIEKNYYPESVQKSEINFPGYKEHHKPRCPNLDNDDETNLRVSEIRELKCRYKNGFCEYTPKIIKETLKRIKRIKSSQKRS